jgi:serine/threonine-protein kinase
MQPDDARGENTLDPALDNHIIAVTGYNGFPAYIPNTAPYDDTIPNVLVPNVVGETQQDAEDAIEADDLVVGNVTTADNAGGATDENDGTVKSQTPAAGTKVNVGSTVNLVVYAYVIPIVEVPNVVGETQADAEDAIEAENLVVGDVTTSADGATEGNDGTVKSQDPAAGTEVNEGTTVDLVVYAFAG